MDSLTILLKNSQQWKKVLKYPPWASFKTSKNQLYLENLLILTHILFLLLLWLKSWRLDVPPSVFHPFEPNKQTWWTGKRAIISLSSRWFTNASVTLWLFPAVRIKSSSAVCKVTASLMVRCCLNTFTCRMSSFPKTAGFDLTVCSPTSAPLSSDLIPAVGGEPPGSGRSWCRCWGRGVRATHQLKRNTAAK